MRIYDTQLAKGPGFVPNRFLQPPAPKSFCLPFNERGKKSLPLFACGILILSFVVISGAGCSKQSRKNRYLAKAARDFQAEQYDRAEIEYLSALKLVPLDPIALGRLGVIYQLQGKSLLAFSCLRKAVELDPGNLEARLKLGLIYSTMHKSAEARSEAMYVLEKEPWNEDALLLLADSAADAQDLNQIADTIDGFRKRDKDRAAYHMACGSIHLHQQNLEKAESELKQAISLDPKDAASYFVLGNLFLLKNDRTQAEQALKMSAALSPWHSARRLTYADFKLKTGASGEAKRIVEEIAQKAPDYLPASLFLARMAASENRSEDVDRLIERILIRDPSNYDALFLRGNLLIARGDGTNAIAQLERVAATYNKDPQVYAHLAVAHLMNLDLAKARSSLNQALALNPDFADAILLLAELDIRQGTAPLAIAAMQKLVDQQPLLARAHLLLADAYLGQKDPRSAISVYHRMMELFPRDPQVPILLGILLAQQNQLDEARRAFEKSLELAPKSISAFEQLVNLDLAEKKYSAATDRVKKRLEETPRSANPWLLFAKIHLAQGETDAAESALLQAIEKEPDLRNPYFLLADLYRKSNRLHPALQKLNAILEKNPSDPAALLQVGIIENALTNFPAARDAYEKLLSINPQSNIGLNNLACLYGEHLAELDKAYELACKSRRLYPSDPYTADTLGWILYKKGDYLHALGSLQESAIYLSADSEVQFHLGMAYYMMGQEEAARLALERANRSTNDFSGKVGILRRLAVLSTDPKTADEHVTKDLENELRTAPRDPMLLCRLAAIRERHNQFQEAGQYYERALELNPQNSFVLSRLAEIKADEPGDLQPALKLAKEAHSLSPQDPRISYIFGRLAYRTGDSEWARSLIEDAASRLQADPDVHYDLALASYAVGEVQKARVAVKNALNMTCPFARRDEASIFLSLVNAAQDTGKIAEETDDAEKVLRTDPQNLAALFLSARGQEQKENYGKAKEIYENILRIAPLFTPATKHLALLSAQHFGDDQKAYELASKVRESSPDDSEVARLLGILTYRLGKDNSDFARSAQLLRESAVKRNDDSELFYYLGLAEYQTKELQECRKALQRALALNLPSKFADDARRLLAKLN